MSHISALIIDDEKYCVDALTYRLTENCPDVKIVGNCQTIASGIDAIQNLRPDLLFLDINLPDGNGFTLLDKIKTPDLQVIFTTAYDQYAIKAFKFNALDYLLKPIGEKDILDAMSRFRLRVSDVSARSHVLSILDEVRRNGAGINKIALPTAHGHVFVLLNDIVRLHSDSNYTTFFMKDKTKYVVSKTLKEYEALLGDLQFVRIHNSDIVNLAFVKESCKGKGGTLLLQDGTELEVAVRRKAAFTEKVSKLLRF
ncbi:MAG: LytTR family DNA-binding domain-containing protein [Chryseolinea sp.]